MKKNTARGLIVLALLLCAVCRWRGAQPHFLFHGLVSIFWVLRLVSQYRVWSPMPQLQTYIFQLLASVFIMLSCYQRTAFDANQGSRRRHTITHLAATFFSCLSVIQCQDWFLYATCALWAITNLCRLIPLPGWKPHLPKKDEKYDPA